MRQAVRQRSSRIRAREHIHWGNHKRPIFKRLSPRGRAQSAQKAAAFQTTAPAAAQSIPLHCSTVAANHRSSLPPPASAVQSARPLSTRLTKNSMPLSQARAQAAFPAAQTQTSSARETRLSPQRSPQSQCRCPQQRSIGIVRDGDQRLSAPAKVHRCRRIALILNRQMQLHSDGFIRQLRAANGLKQLRSLPEKKLRRYDRIPKHIAKSTQRRLAGSNLIPISISSLCCIAPMRSSLPALCTTVPE